VRSGRIVYRHRSWLVDSIEPTGTSFRRSIPDAFRLLRGAECTEPVALSSRGADGYARVSGEAVDECPRSVASGVCSKRSPAVAQPPQVERLTPWKTARSCLAALTPCHPGCVAFVAASLPRERYVGAPHRAGLVREREAVGSVLSGQVCSRRRCRIGSHLQRARRAAQLAGRFVRGSRLASAGLAGDEFAAV
jgi:hypothetical protein